MIPAAVQNYIDRAFQGDEQIFVSKAQLDAFAALAVRETARECIADLHDRASLLDPDHALCNRYSRTKLLDAAERFCIKYGVTP